MVTMQPPPAYSGGQQAPPSYSGNQAPPSYSGNQAPPSYSGNQAPPPPASSGEGGKRQNPGAYWGYWISLFVTTIFTWIFAVAAAADDAWIEDLSGFGLGESCDGPDYCGLYKAATAFQYLATIVISVVLVVVVVAAFMPAPVTGKLGLAVAVMLFVFALFELIAFCTFAAFIEELEDSYYVSYYSGVYSVDFSPGPALAVAVVAFIFGLVGAIVTCVLRNKATTEQDGPFRACMSNVKAGSAPSSAPPAAAGVATAGAGAVPQPGAAPAGTKAPQYPTVGTV